MADEVWSPPEYMHKARTSDTSFLNEKVRLTAKEILEAKKKKNIKKDRLKLSKTTHHAASSVNITTKLSKKKKKNLTSPKPVAVTHSMTFLDSIANEYESSESENDSIDVIETIHTNDQTEEKKGTESEQNDKKIVQIEEIQIEAKSNIEIQTVEKKESETDHEENDEIIQIDTEMTELNAKPEIQIEPKSEIKEIETNKSEMYSEAQTEVKSPSIIVTDHENNVSTPTILSQSHSENFIVDNTECLLSDTEDMKESMPLEKLLDESSLLSILQTLDCTKLDKDGNGLISQHYFRYFFKQKIKKNIADQKILKIFQDIKKENDSMYISTKQYEEWAAALTPFLLDKILSKKLIVHSRKSGSNSFYLDQSSLIGFLKSIRIKDINDDIGVVKMFDFALFVRRNYDNWNDVADTDLVDKIYWDVHNGHHDDRLTNDQWNKWQKQLTQLHLDKVFAIQLPKDYKHQKSPRFAAMNSKSNNKSPKFASLQVEN